MTITYPTHGSIVDDDADILVNTVNCVGVMGAGVALAFKKKWPMIMDEYREACRLEVIIPGSCSLFHLPDLKIWAALATKDHWKKPSKIEWIENGLLELKRGAHTVMAKSIAIPRPGCGHGGLSWAAVEPLVVSALSDFDLRIYL